jgi:polyhydroxybutyrate depolymerase
MRLVAAIVFALLAFPCTADPRSDSQEAIELDGVARTFFVHVPQGLDPKRPAPLVVVFHGGGGNAMNGANMSGMSAKADAGGFIVAYPNGTGPGAWNLLTWNTWRCCGYAFDQHVDDVKFVRAMVRTLSAEYAIDPKRIYATGMSNGGMMAYRLGCEAADLFAAIAPVAGALDTESCKPSAPVSAIIFHGEADKHVPYQGGKPTATIDRRHPRVDNPVSYAVDVFTRANGCALQPTRTKTGHVRHDVYSTCKNATAVELYSIEGQGHAWPGGQKGLRAGNVDPPTTEISATNLMWDFFKAHPKP